MFKHPGSAYVVTFATTAMSTVAQNVFPFQAGANTRVVLEEINLGIASTLAASVGVSIYRGSTTPLSTAAYGTLVNLDGWSGASTAGSRVNPPSSALPSTASAVLIDARNFEDGFHYTFKGRGDVILAPSQRVDVVIQALPVTSVFATFKIREIGKNPV